jgi:hypothetical protein
MLTFVKPCHSLFARAGSPAHHRFYLLYGSLGPGRSYLQAGESELADEENPLIPIILDVIAKVRS